MSWQRTISVIAAMLLVTLPAPPYAAAQGTPCGGDQYGCFGDDEIIAGDQREGSPGEEGGPDGEATPVGDAGPRLEYAYVPACMPNGPPNRDGTITGDALCMGAVDSCPDEEDIRYRVFVREAGSRDAWESRGTECRGLDDPAARTPTPAERALAAWERWPLPHPEIHARPSAGRGVVSLPTYFWVTAVGEDGLPATWSVAGALPDIPGLRPVQVRGSATIVWRFGDGTGAQGPGQAWPRRSDVNHAFGSTGGFTVTADAVWRGEYSEDGGATWQPIRDQAILSGTLDYDVREIGTVITD